MGVAVDADDVALHQNQLVPPVGPAHFRAQQMPDIGAEQTARHEAAGGGRHAIELAVRQRLKPAQEIVLVLMEGTHPSRRHVQQMVRIAGGIGLAEAELAVALDQHDAGARLDIAAAGATRAACR